MTPTDSDHRDDVETPAGSPELKERATAYFDGAMPPGERAAFEREMVANPDTARAVYEQMGMGPVYHEALQALRIRHLESHARLPDRSVTKRVPWWGRTRSRFALTAIVSALVIVVVLVSNIGEPPQVSERFLPAGGPGGEGFRGLSPSGAVEALPFQFTWTPHPNAAHYRLEIYDKSSGKFFETITGHTSLIVALDELAERGLRLGYWRVVPLDPHGSELDPTQTVSFTVSVP